MKEISAEDYGSEVTDASFTKPVILDIWDPT